MTSYEGLNKVLTDMLIGIQNLGKTATPEQLILLSGLLDNTVFALEFTKMLKKNNDFIKEFSSLIS